MIGEDAAFTLLERALTLSTAEQTDVYLSSQDLGLTRFAGNAIHQNVSHSNVTLNIRAVEGRRLGRATTNDTSDDGIRKAMEAAKGNALLMPEDPAFPGLPEGQPAARVASWDESAAACSPLTRAQMVGEVCRQGAAEGLDTAGACRTGVQEIAVVSSRGVRAYHAGTFAGLIITTRSDTSAGWAKGGSWRLDEIDYPRLASEAVDKAVQGRDPQPITPGEYAVVLDHYAVDDILEALSLYGMGAQAVQEGRSWMCGIQGTRAMSESVSIWDDGEVAGRMAGALRRGGCAAPPGGAGGERGGQRPGAQHLHSGAGRGWVHRASGILCRPAHRVQHIHAVRETRRWRGSLPQRSGGCTSLGSSTHAYPTTGAA